MYLTLFIVYLLILISKRKKTQMRYNSNVIIIDYILQMTQRKESLIFSMDSLEFQSPLVYVFLASGI